jgi:arginyl-tRNA synthetase
MFDNDEEFRKESKANVVLLQGGDEKILKAWEYICDISRQNFNKIYKKLDVEIEEVGESFYNPLIPGMIQHLMDEGYAVVDQGAKCLFVPGQKVPLMIQKSDGGYNYDSTDITAIHYRLKTLG